MSGGVPKRISISRTQANTYCKSGGTNKVPGLVLCSRGRSRTAMCNYIKKRVKHREKPAPRDERPSNPDAPIETVNFNNPINTGVLGGKNIYQFITNGSLQINLRSPKPNTADYVPEPIKNACGQITGYKSSNTAKTVSFDLEYYMIGGGGAGGQGVSGGAEAFGGGGAAGVVRQGTITVSGQLGTTINVDLYVGGGGGSSGNNGSQSGSGGDSAVGGCCEFVVAKGGEGGFAGGGGSGGDGGRNVDFAGGENDQTEPALAAQRAAGGAGAGGMGGNAIGEQLQNPSPFNGGGYLMNGNSPQLANQSAGVLVNFANDGWIELPGVPFELIQLSTIPPTFVSNGNQTIGGGGGGACITGANGSQLSGAGGQGPITPQLLATGSKVGGDGVGGGLSVGSAAYNPGSAGVANTGSGGGGGNFVSPVAVSGKSGGNGFVQVRFLSSLL